MAAAGIGASVEGTHSVLAALDNGRVNRLLVEPRRADSDLIDRAKDLGVPVVSIDDVRPHAATTAPQGVVAECRPIQPVSLEVLIDQSTPASMVIVDHVEDPHNLGAIARSAVAAGIPRLVVPSRRTSPLGAAAFKAAAGALEYMSIAVVNSVADAVMRLGDHQVWTVGLDADGDKSLFGLELLTEPVALVVGAEAGLHRLVRERVDVVASIPMAGPTESLNASVAAALACFELMRVRQTQV